MYPHKQYPKLCFVLLGILFYACSPNVNPVRECRNVSVAYLKSLYKGVPQTITDDITVEGWVVSTDQFGEWYKTLVIEDNTGGIELKLSQTNLFHTYRWGATVLVECNGVVLDGYGGVIQLLNPHISVTGQLAEAPVATTVKIGGLETSHISSYVRFDDVQFVAEETELPLCQMGEYTNRHIVDYQRDTLTVRVSPHSIFATFPIPYQSGIVLGILSCFNGEYELRLNQYADLIMQNDRF